MGGGEWHVYQMNEYDYIAATSVKAAKEYIREVTGMSDEDLIDEYHLHQLDGEEMECKKFRNDDGSIVTFAEAFQDLMRSHPPDNAAYFAFVE